MPSENHRRRVRNAAAVIGCVLCGVLRAEGGGCDQGPPDGSGAGGGQGSAPPVGLVIDRPETATGHVSFLRSGRVTWQPDALECLREGVSFQAQVFEKSYRLTTEKSVKEPRRTLHRGRIEGEPTGWFLFFVRHPGARATGMIRAGGKEYHVRGDHVREVDPSLVPGCGNELAPGQGRARPGAEDRHRDTAPSPGGDRPPDPGAPGAVVDPFDAARPSKTLITLLVGFTAESIPLFPAGPGEPPDAGIKDQIELSKDLLNDALDSSGVNVEVRLIESMQINGYEVPGVKTAQQVLNDVTSGGGAPLAALRSRRSQVGADLVCLYVSLFQDANEVAGIAWLLEFFDRKPSLGFSVVMAQFAGLHLTFAHEIGHNLGCGHEIDNQFPGGAFPYSHGFRKSSAETEHPFRTIMAYPSPDDPFQLRIPFFSNPDLEFEEQPIGEEGVADNSRTIGQTAGHVASYLVDRIVIANAGADRVVTDREGDGEAVTLDGRRSTPPFGGTITTFAWLDEAGVQLAGTVTHTLVLPVGRHDFTLRVTGSNGTVDEDHLTVFVVPFVCPVADAGDDQVVGQVDADPVDVLLDGSATTDPDHRVFQYEWWLGEPDAGTLLESTPAPKAIISSDQLVAGTNVVTLRLVVNLDGLVDPELVALCGGPDRVVITVVPEVQVQTVPDEFLTIQEAIDFAIDGDMVFVRAGTYSGEGNRDLTFGGKKIVVRGESAETTIIDCLDTVNTGALAWHRGFRFVDDEDNRSILERFTIINGRIGDLTSAVDPLIALRQQAAGGDPVAQAQVDHFDQTILELDGGAILVRFNSAPRLQDLIIFDNQAQFDGGGIAIITPRGRRVRLIQRFRIHHNQSKFGNGGGIAVVNRPVSTPDSDADVEIRDGLAHDNEARTRTLLRTSGFGGGVAVSGVSTILVNDTITENTAVQGGGVAYFRWTVLTQEPGMQIMNGIIWRNTATLSGSQIFTFRTTAITVTFTDVEGGFTGTGNINLDPRFVAPLADDFHLQLGSPGPIDAANGGVASRRDLDGVLRFDAPSVPNTGIGSPEFVDMGCFEFRPRVRFIRGDCNGDGQVAGQVTDAVFLLAFNFNGGDPPPCLAACDVNGDGDTGGVTDAISLLAFNFQGSGIPPVPPFPNCGTGTLPSDEILGCSTPSAGCE